MRPAHKLLLGFSAVCLALMFVIACRPPDAAELEYVPPQPPEETRPASSADPRPAGYEVVADEKPAAP